MENGPSIIWEFSQDVFHNLRIFSIAVDVSSRAATLGATKGSTDSRNIEQINPALFSLRHHWGNWSTICQDLEGN